MRGDTSEPEEKDREEPEARDEHAMPEDRQSVVSIVQQNAVIINGRRASAREPDGRWV